MGQLAAEYGPAPAETGRQYFTADHLGSTRLVTDAGGGVTKTLDYLPFGEELNVACLAAPGGVKFTGQVRDPETCEDYFKARYMASAEGRFTSPDPISGSVFDPQTLNMYSYGWNNPLRYTDPTGMVVSWEDSEAKCSKDEEVCRTSLQRQYEDRISSLQSSKNSKDQARGNALAKTYQQLKDASETFHVVRGGSDGAGELAYRGTPGDLYVEMTGSGSQYGELPDLQKLGHEFKHGEQFLNGLIGFTNITGKWKGYRDDLVDEANAFMAGFMAEQVGLDQTKFLQGVGKAAASGVDAVIKKLNESSSPYSGRAAQQQSITMGANGALPPSVYAVPRSK